MVRNGIRRLAWGCVLCLAGSTWAATVLTSLTETRDGTTGDRIVSFQFAPAIPPFEISIAGEHRFVIVDALPAEGSSLGSALQVTGGHARFDLGTAAARVVGVKSQGDRLDVRLAPADADPAAQAGYKIGPADLVNILVYKNADISGDYSVSPDGTIALPLVGALSASGLDENQLADKVREKLSDFLVDPQVSVMVKTYQSQYVYVTGSVPRASRVALRPAMTLNDILSEAGVTLLPGQRFTLSHRGEAQPFASYESSTNEADRTAALKDGDVISVEEPKYFYVQGEVRHQGRFPLTGGVTLLEALAVAEGLTDWASKKDVRILRSTGGQKREIEVNLNKVEGRKAEDPKLEAGDYILVKRRIL
ncbi:MAG TPA: polysaccharide biosynthesis/export family protein [Candidatus Polarisedimenticolaceae bacterium]|nr:polysaccharide biosynthesis/export family protein [Candidatus Polarisedimenticolaceae bacterium]